MMWTRDVVLVLDHFRPERHAVTQLYNKHFLGVVYIVDATGWPGCLKIRPAQAWLHRRLVVLLREVVVEHALRCFGSASS